MIVLQASMRIVAVTSFISLIGTAYIWLSAVLYQAVDEAEVRGERSAAATFRKQRKTEITPLRKRAAEGWMRAKQV